MSRLLAVATIFSTLLLAVAPALGHQTQAVRYADWLREQVRVPVDEALERSIADASSERFTNVQAFLIAVVDDLESSGEDAGRLFGAEGLSGVHLVSHLESRFSHLTTDALPARTLLTVAPTTTVSTDRFSAVIAAEETVPHSLSVSDVGACLILAGAASGPASPACPRGP